MLYWKRRDGKIALDEVTAADNSASSDTINIPIDQNYDATSPNAQSGTAVSQAVSEVEAQITAKYGSALRYKGTKTSYTQLQAETNHEKGDVWNVTDTNANYVWDGSTWDKLSENLEGYVTTNTFNTLQTSFNTHKTNKDPDLHHLTDAELDKVQSLENVTEESLRAAIVQKIQEQIATGNLVTKEALQNNLTNLETTVQQNITQNITETLSEDYVLNSDFAQYQQEHENDLKNFIKCEQADELKVYTPGGEAAPPLSERQDRVLYIVGDGASIAGISL